MKRPFIVFADSFNENNGGVIALHRLCDLLNREGERALLWPARRPPWYAERRLSSAWSALRFGARQLRKPYRVWPGFVTPLAQSEELPGAIVVYPEIVVGNPLRGDRVVRWLLHKPGFHKGKIGFGAADRFFFYQHAFNDPALNPDASNLLKTVFLRDDIYRRWNFGPRHGTCYILRKGKGRTTVHDLRDSVCVDKLSHAAMAEVFNRVATCVSYDAYTMYSHFAALCGCDSVIVPEEGVSKESWYPDPDDRLGLAYGFDDIDNARASAPRLLAHLKAQESTANTTVSAFVAKCVGYFP
jgi:hypothetical protein